MPRKDDYDFFVVLCQPDCGSNSLNLFKESSECPSQRFSPSLNLLEGGGENKSSGKEKFLLLRTDFKNRIHINLSNLWWRVLIMTGVNAVSISKSASFVRDLFFEDFHQVRANGKLPR